MVLIVWERVYILKFTRKLQLKGFPRTEILSNIDGKARWVNGYWSELSTWKYHISTSNSRQNIRFLKYISGRQLFGHIQAILYASNQLKLESIFFVYCQYAYLFPSVYLLRVWFQFSRWVGFKSNIFIERGIISVWTIQHKLY